ncbi:MAG: vWA domain-containing protein [Actinomycetota bacterium]
MIGRRRSRTCKRVQGTLLVLACLGSIAPAAAPAGAAPARSRVGPSSVLLILDASGSMEARLGGTTRLAVAKDAVRAMVAGMPQESRVGLRVYGGRTENPRRGCKDSRLLVPVRRLDRGRVLRRVRGIRAVGSTPIGFALRAGRRDLPRRGDRTIIVVSDGIDTCAPPPPCKVARRIGGGSLRIDAVGFEVNRQARRQLRCIARAGKGDFVDARSARQLTRRLQRLALRAVRTFEVEGRRISGAPKPSAAPTLGRGRYVDRIEGNEDLWYAVDLDRGQTLDVDPTVVGDSIGPRSRFGLFAVRIYTPALLSPLDARATAAFTGLATITTSAGTARIGLERSPAKWARAGEHYVRLTLDDAPELRARRYPVELRIGIDGAVVRRRPPQPSEPVAWIWITAACGLGGAILGAVVTRTVRAVVDR